MTKKEISKAASILGHMAKGVPKRLSAEERARRAEQMRKNRLVVRPLAG